MTWPTTETTDSPWHGVGVGMWRAQEGSSIWERREEEKDKSRRDLLYDCAPAPGTAKAGALVHVSITWYLGTRSYLLYMYLPKLIGTVVHVGANAKNILNPTA